VKRPRAIAAALVLAAVGGGACGRTAYLVRSGLMEARILWGREPIVEVLARPDLDPTLRERLELTLAVRRHARDALGLAVGDSFSTFAEVEGDALVWVVSAAHRDRLEAYTWWYPVVGRVPYQGHFARADADAAARRLAAAGLDVDVRPAAAFSTLGWFADPLLSVTAKAGPVTLAETIVHELFHATLYLPGQATFNESAATFVGHRGAIDFFCRDGGDARRCGDARARWAAVRAHGRVLARYARRLRALYAMAPPPAEREAPRARLAAAAGRTLVRRDLGAAGELSPPNNARLLGMLAYETRLEAFERAVARLVAAARGAADAFAAVEALSTAGERHPGGVLARR
jgi:predicted aminopeptidase